MFHFNQAIHRKITDLGLAKDYLHDENIRGYCRQLMALSLLPIDEVANQFQRLHAIMPTPLNDLLSYFKHQWMYGVVPIQMWNFHDISHRTNNTSEGEEISNLYLFHFNVLPFTICNLAYNLRFSTRLSKKHLNIWTFIQLIQSEHVRFEHICIQLDTGATAPKQSTKTISFQKRFDTLLNRFLDKTIDANKLL
jgi:hypothetical protein